jgi:hypothetical protein
MTVALTPALALAYLSELSADVRAAIVLDAAGEVLAVSRTGAPRVGGGGARGPRAAGSPGGGGAREARAAGSPGGGEALGGESALVAAARDLLAEAPVVRALTDRGGAFGARDELHGVVVATGPLVLPGLAIHDVLGVLAALGGMPPHVPVSDASPVAARAVLDAL